MTYAATRWFSYVATFAIIGATLFRVWLMPRIVGAGPEQVAAMSGRAVLAGRVAAVGLAFAILLKLYLQSRAMIEPDEQLSFEIVRLVVGSAWGRGWLAQGAGALGALIAWRAFAKPTPARWATAVAVVSSLGLVLAMPLTGHAIGLPAAGRLGYPLTVVHVGGGAAWLGTLGILLIAAIGPSDPAFRLGPLIRAYSTIALPAGLVTIGCGLVVAWRYVGGFDALITTTYGNVLLGKVAALAAIAATGAYNWRVVLPRLETGQTAPLRRTAAVETVVGLILLAVTAVLVSLAAPSELAH